MYTFCARCMESQKVVALFSVRRVNAEWPLLLSAAVRLTIKSGPIAQQSFDACTDLRAEHRELRSERDGPAT
jgi:hypothetical protein